MENKESTIVDKEKVKERIDHFIRNDGKTNIYVNAPDIKTVANYLRFEDQKEYLPSLLKLGGSCAPGAMPALVADFSKAKITVGLNRDLFSTEYKCHLIEARARYVITPLYRIWNTARYWEENPLKGLKKVCFWNWGAQKSLDKQFRKNLQTAYQWLQEEEPLEQCDFKNNHAIFGLNLLNIFNKSHPTIKPAPLNEFVAEQIETIPEEVIDKTLKGKLDFKWVNGKRIINMDCTLGELYGNQLQQAN